MDPYRDTRVTINDVAARAGVSRTSVSNYFHRPHKLSEATRARIGTAMDELRFSPNAAASTLRTGQNPVVGYVAFELASARTPEIANAVATSLKEAGFYTVLAVDQADPSRELDYIDLFVRQRLSGLLVSPIGDIESELLRVRDTAFPVVVAGRRSMSDQLPCVAVDHRIGGRAAAEHVLSQGRKRLAFAADTLALLQISDRYHGASAAAEGAPGATLELIEISERSIAGGRALGEQLLAVPAEQRPDALLCVNDLVAIGVIERLSEHLDIPRDIAVVGYDDISFASANRIPLTTVHTPQEDLGTFAAAMLLAEIEARHAGRTSPAEKKLFEPELVIRASA